MILSIDIETRSRVNLNKTGVYPYAMDESTYILCIMYKLGDSETKWFTPEKGSVLTREDYDKSDFKKVYESDDVIYQAFNESFERIVLNHLGVKKLGLKPTHYRRWRCSMAVCAYFNLPMSLQGAGNALRLTMKKDMSGSSAMKLLCKPEKKTDQFLERENHPELFNKLYDYCETDVEAESEISRILGWLPPQEEEVFHVDKEVNGNGLTIDTDLVTKALEIDNKYTDALIAEFEELTKVGPRKREAVKAYMKENFAIEFDDLKAVTIDKFLETTENTEAKKIITMYQEINKKSATKLNRFLTCTIGGRIHGTLQYYGATSTGRWGGRLIQPQNLPSRAVVKDVDELFVDLKILEPSEFIEKYKAQGLKKVIASMIRGFIIAPKGSDMFVYDYSAIEGRVVAWLCQVESDLIALKNDLCIYRELGKTIFNMSHDEAHALRKDSDERYILKVASLSLCYGTGHKSMGDKIFLETNGRIDIRCNCKKKDENGRVIHVCEAKRIVEVYRASRPTMTNLWSEFEEKLKYCVEHEGTVVKIGGLFKARKSKGFMHVQIPSGRVLRFPSMKVVEVKRTFEGGQTKVVEQLVYFGKATGKKTAEENDDEEYSAMWRKNYMYGAKIFQNCIQALARDIMAGAIIKVSKLGYKVVLTVHDELVALGEEGRDCQDLIEAMIEPPSWAPTIPLRVEGKRCKRYHK
jgi:DNA polymerase bacteriophage-type